MTWKKRDYSDPHYKQFRLDVLRRDKFTCQMCGHKRKYDLQVHHLLTWADCPTLRYERSNGITLCKTCHKQVTGYESSYASYLNEIVKKNERRT